MFTIYNDEWKVQIYVIVTDLEKYIHGKRKYRAKCPL